MSALGGMRRALDDGRISTAAAIVCVPTGEASHYYVNEEGDVIINCQVHQGGALVRANLAAMVGARGQGLWVIPDPGVEVMVGFDHGDFEGEGYLLACFPSGRSPAGLVPGKVFVIGMTVEIRSANGTAKAVPTMDDFNGIISILNSSGTGSATAVPAAVTTYQGSNPTWPEGTTVLKAE